MADADTIKVRVEPDLDPVGFEQKVRAGLADMLGRIAYDMRQPAFGTRESDGGVEGTIVRCEMCGGSGRLHLPDNLPPTATPDG